MDIIDRMTKVLARAEQRGWKGTYFVFALMNSRLAVGIVGDRGGHTYESNPIPVDHPKFDQAFSIAIEQGMDLAGSDLEALAAAAAAGASEGEVAALAGGESDS